MKHIVFIIIVVFACSYAHAQNVGIGTSNPAYKLHVESVTDNVMLLKTTGPIQQSLMFFQHANLNVPVGYIGASEGNMQVGVNALANPGDLEFYTNNAKQMQLLKSGRLVVGPIVGPGFAKLMVTDTTFVAGNGVVAQFKTTAPIADILFWDEEGQAGRVGSYYDWLRIHAYRTTPNPSNGIRFDVHNEMKAYINRDGHMGINNGNLYLHNSPTGIHLNGADRPIITRSFDAFTSGNYTGAGRWGLFMEPSRLTFGIPNLVNKAFEFASYDANSTRNVILQIDRVGTMRRPDNTGNADLLPIAIGNIKADGTFQGGSGNFISSKISNGLYNIDFTNFDYTDASNIVIATLIRQNNTDCVLQAKQGLNGALNIFVKTDAGIPADQAFHFVIYKN